MIFSFEFHFQQFQVPGQEFEPVDLDLQLLGLMGHSDLEHHLNFELDPKLLDLEMLDLRQTVCTCQNVTSIV